MEVRQPLGGDDHLEILGGDQVRPAGRRGVGRTRRRDDRSIGPGGSTTSSRGIDGGSHAVRLSSGCEEFLHPRGPIMRLPKHHWTIGAYRCHL